MITVTRFTEIKCLERLRPPILFYGRRKTGKTFLAKTYFRGAEYFFVKRNRTVYWENRGRVLDYGEFTSIFELLGDRLVIVDEFHRLPGDFLDYLHARQPRNIVLITSTLFLAKNILSKRSPLLGLLLEYRVDLIDERDILVNLCTRFSGRELVEKSVFLREPILLQWAELPVFEILRRLRLTVPALVGEVFLEEDRKLTERYEGVLRAVSSGKQTMGEITSYLYSRKLVESQNPSLVKVYVKNLLEIGLLKRYREFSREKYYYTVASPMIDLYFYLDEKYNFSEADLADEYFRERIPFYVEDFFRNLLAKVFKYRIFAVKKPSLEVDIALGDHRRLRLVGEVKWRSRVEREDFRRIEGKLERFKGARRVLIVPDKRVLEEYPDNVEVWDIGDILELTHNALGLKRSKG